MDTLPKPSSIKKLVMWYKVKEYSSKKLNKVQISRLTGLHRQTVSKFLKMSEAEFVASQTYCRNYAHNLDALIHQAQQDKPTYLEFLSSVLTKECRHAGNETLNAA
jgi:hypothetical protein